MPDPATTEASREPNVPAGPRIDRRGETGATLVEVVISITLMGTVIAAIVGALLSSVVASSTAVDSAELEAVLITASDHLDRAEPNCNYDEQLDAVATSQGWAAGSIIGTYQLLVHDDDGTAQFESVDCDEILAGDVQTIVITATHPFGGQSRTLKVVKSSVR